MIRRLLTVAALSAATLAALTPAPAHADSYCIVLNYQVPPVSPGTYCLVAGNGQLGIQPSH